MIRHRPAAAPDGIGGTSVASLTKGASVSLSKSVKIPADAGEGPHHILVFVDSLGVINESDEDNNIAPVPLQIAALPHISAVLSNHQDIAGPNHATVSTYTFRKGGDDYFARITEQDKLLSILSYPRLGLWVEASVTNNGPKDVFGLVTGKIQYPGGQCPDVKCYDMASPTYLGDWDLTAKAGAITKINFPIIPVTGPSVEPGEYRIFLKFKEAYNFNSPSMYMTIDDNAVADAAVRS